MEVKMAATTRILKKLSLGHLTELFHRDNNDIISSQQGTGGHDGFAITIMLHTRIKGVSRPRNLFRLMFYGHAIFKGNSQKEARCLYSPVYRCRVDQIVKNHAGLK